MSIPERWLALNQDGNVVARGHSLDAIINGGYEIVTIWEWMGSAYRLRADWIT